MRLALACAVAQGADVFFAGRADKPLRFRRGLAAFVYAAPMHLSIASSWSGRPVAPNLPGDTGSGGDYGNTLHRQWS